MKDSTDARIDSLLGRISVADPTRALHRRLVDMFAGSSVAARRTTWRQRIAAVLVSDAVPGLAGAGARGAHTVRQLKYSASIAECTLQLRRAERGVRLDGVIVPSDGSEQSFDVRLEQPGEPAQTIRTNDFGEFRLTASAARPATIVVGIDAHDLVLGPIDLIENDDSGSSESEGASPA